MSELHNRMKSKGFSLLEMLAVIALLAILFSIGIPSFMRGRINATAREEARELLADLQLAQSYAKTAGSTAKLEWDNPKSESPGYRVLDNDGVVRKKKTFESRIYADFSGWPGTSVEFYGNGSASHEGSIQVKVRGAEGQKRFDYSIVKATGLINFKEVN